VQVGFLSNLNPEKGLNVVIDAAIRCHERGLDIEFVIAGPTVGAEAADDISWARKSFGDFIEIRGPVSGQAKAAFFETVDVFLFPSRYRCEAQPLVSLEAMSYGLPIIALCRGAGGPWQHRHDG
jgi:glycosyltransferase involved in cell wall biosynthesis